MNVEVNLDEKLSFYSNGRVRSLLLRSFANGKLKMEILKEYCSSGFCTRCSHKKFHPGGTLATVSEQRYNFGSCVSTWQTEFDQQGKLVRDHESCFPSITLTVDIPN